MQWFKIK